MATGRPDFRQGMDIEAVDIGNIAIDIAAQSLAKMKVDIISQTLTQLKIDIQAQTIGNLNIDLVAQALDRISTISRAPTGTTPVFKSALRINGTTILHTVTAGKTLFLTGATLGLSSLDVAEAGYLAVRNVANAIQYYIFRAGLEASENNSANLAFSLPAVPPIEIAAGWDIVVYSPSAGFASAGAISGWEETA